MSTRSEYRLSSSAAINRGNPDEVILLRALSKNEEPALNRVAQQ